MCRLVTRERVTMHAEIASLPTLPAGKVRQDRATSQLVQQRRICGAWQAYGAGVWLSCEASSKTNHRRECHRDH